MGVVYIFFNRVQYIVPCINIIVWTSFCLCCFSTKFWVVAQKPLGRHGCAARRPISCGPFSRFCYGPPGGDELLPGDISLILGLFWCCCARVTLTPGIGLFKPYWVPYYYRTYENYGCGKSLENNCAWSIMNTCSNFGREWIGVDSRE